MSSCLSVCLSLFLSGIVCVFQSVCLSVFTVVIVNSCILFVLRWDVPGPSDYTGKRESCKDDFGACNLKSGERSGTLHFPAFSMHICSWKYEVNYCTSYVFASYVTLLSDMPWNIPQVTSILLVYTRYTCAIAVVQIL